MADGAIVVGSYDPYALTVHGDVVIGIYDPYPLTVHGALIVGIFGEAYEEGVLPTYNPSLISSLARVQQNMPFPQFIIGGRGGANQDEYQLFKKSTDYAFYVWRSHVYQIGTDFDILSITLPMVTDIDPGINIVPKLYFDDRSRTAMGTAITASNYPDNNKLIRLTAKNFDNSVHGKSNFFLELQIASTILSVVGLPITIDIDEQ